MATATEILTTLLALVDDKYDKRVGSFIYDALAPVAEKFAAIDLSIDDVKNKMVIDNLTGDELAQRVKERTGLERKQAKKAIGVVTVTGTGTINTGDLFETTEGVQFKATETKTITSSGNANIEAVIAGSGSNVPAQTIKLFPITLAGFTACTNASPTTGGANKESDSSLITRYYEYLQNPPTSGNQAAYIAWAKEASSGVGNVKCIPAWNGSNSVKLIIADADGLPVTSTLLDTVKTYIDSSNNGIGEGKAPIGTVLTVESAVAKNIDISVDVEIKAGYTLSQVTSNIQTKINSYFTSVAFVHDFVSYAQIGSQIIEADGINDYQNLLVNSGTSNVSLASNEVPKLNSLIVT